MQRCVRELFLLGTVHDLELHVTHQPGVEMGRADALSRAHTGQVYVDRIFNDNKLSRARQLRIPQEVFMITDTM